MWYNKNEENCFIQWNLRCKTTVMRDRPPMWEHSKSTVLKSIISVYLHLRWETTYNLRPQNWSHRVVLHHRFHCSSLDIDGVMYLWSYASFPIHLTVSNYYIFSTAHEQCIWCICHCHNCAYDSIVKGNLECTCNKN